MAALSRTTIQRPSRECVYCLENGHIRKNQILVRGQHLYLCAPLGQLVEGYLAISPYACIPALSRLPSAQFEELNWLKSIATDFYRHSYSVPRPTVYEQGRGGGGAVADRAAGFPLHAHLCLLPAAVDLHSILVSKYVPVPMRFFDELPKAAHKRPYVYLEGPDPSGDFRTVTYLGRSVCADEELEAERLKPLVAAALNMPERGDWRRYPGMDELGQVIAHFAEFIRAYEPGGTRMRDLFEGVDQLKHLARSQRAQGQYHEAAKTFKKGISILEQSPPAEDKETQHRAENELAELYGMLGGTWREKADFVQAAQAYDAGFRYESSLQGKTRSSYNALNRLTTRILLRPESLTNTATLELETRLEFVDVPRELADLRTRLNLQVGRDRSDYWAFGDLAIVDALLGDDEGVKTAAEQFASCSPPPSARNACLKSIRALAALDTPRKQSLQRLAAEFQ